MDPWDHIRRAAADRRSGSLEIAERAALGFAGLRTKRDVMRAARALLRAHPAMAPLWRLSAEALDADDGATDYVELLRAQTDAAADNARWVVTRRASVVVTHSASGSVVRALGRVRGKIARVICTASLPGGEGRIFARRLEREGFDTEVIPDAGMALACDEAHIAFVGADAVTEEGVINKVGTRLLALAARDAGIGCYAIAPTTKLLPASVWRGIEAPDYESTPLELFDAILTEQGPKRPAAIRRSAARVQIPRPLTGGRR